MARLQLLALGAVRLLGPGGEELAPGRRKELALLAYVARRAPRAVPRSELQLLLWGDRPEERARSSLRQALFQLRRLVGEGLEVTPRTVALREDAAELDVTAFERDVAEGRLAEAVARWRGPFLAGAEDAGGEEYRLWVERERTVLARLLADASESLVAAAEAEGAWTVAAGHARRWAEALPLDERAHARLVHALSMAGRAAEAAGVHTAFVARCRADLQAEPSAAFLRLAPHPGRAARAPASPGSAALFTPDLVGRGPVLAELEAAWRAARAGEPGVVVIEGETGSGRTRLLDEFLGALRRRDEALVLAARGYEAERDVPFAAARALLAPLADAPGLLGASPEALARLASLVPLRTVVEGTREPPPVDAAADAVAQVLAAVAHEVPVAVVFDDLRLADDRSRALLLALARRLRAGAVLLVLTAVPGCVSRRAELRDHPALHWLTLRPLEAAEVEALLASMMELAPDDRAALAARLTRERGGNPFDVVEVVRALVDQGRLAPDPAGAWRLAAAEAEAPLPTPASVREAVHARVARLGGDARTALAAAAVLAQPFDVALLEAVAGAHGDTVAAGVDELLARRLVRRSTTEPGRHELASALLAQAAYGLLADDERRTLHERAAAALGARSDARSAAAAAHHRARGATATPARPAARRRWRFALAGATAVVALAATAWGARHLLRAASGSATPVMVVAPPSVGGDTVAAWVAEALPRLVSARLGRSGLVDVVPPERWRAVRERAAAPGDTLSTPLLLELGRSVGGTWVVQGALTRGGGLLLLDLRVHGVDGDGSVTRLHATGRDVITLADAASAQLLRLAGATRPGPRLADLETSSAAAYEQYVRAIRAGHEGRFAEHLARLDTAIALDSTFASAVWARIRAYYGVFNAPPVPELEALYRRLADRLSERDRLELEATAAFRNGEHARSEMLAERLVRRYPNDARGYDVLAEIYEKHGRMADAERVVVAALRLDSLGMEVGTGPCSPCQGWGGLYRLRMLRSDFGGAERASRRWLELQPDVPVAWLNLANALAAQRRSDEALRTARRALALSGGDPFYVFQFGQQLLMARRHASLDSATAVWSSSADRAVRELALDLRMLLARERGQWRRSLALFDSLVSVFPEDSALLMVRGDGMARLGDAAGIRRLYARGVHDPPGRPLPVPLVGEAARGFTWHHVQEAAALLRAGDTVRPALLVDSLQRLAARSYYARDWRAHHFVRGLLAQRRGDAATALAQLDSARWGSGEWKQVEVARAGVLLAQGRPREAIAALRLASSGNHDSMGRYVPRSELDWWLAVAFRAAGQPDSAQVYADHVRRAWREADPEARALLAELP